MEEKRIFVGNLPLTANEEEVKEKFSKFGTVVSTEIKQRFGVENEIISKFAFVTLEAHRSNFNNCMQTLSSSTWKGHNLKLEFAKESFLNKLKRERDKHLQDAAANKDKIISFELKKTTSVKESLKFNNLALIPVHSNGYNSDSSSEELKKDLPMFKGTKSFTQKEETGFKKAKGQSKKLASMKTFEDFSEVWRDSSDVQFSKDIPMDTEYNHFEPSFTNDNIKKTDKSDRNKEESTKIAPEKMTQSKWFTKSVNKQIENDFNNLQESSSEDDYKTFKNKSFSLPKHKLDDMEIVSADYLEHGFSKNSNFQNNWLTGKINTDHKDEILQSDTDSQKKRKKENIQLKIDSKNIKDESTSLPTQILKSDFGKLAEEKRKKAFEEKRQLFMQQKNAVKIALAGIDNKGKPNKKIVFSDNEDAINIEINKQKNSITSLKDVGIEKKMLFDDQSDDEISFKIGTNQQFDGVKGQKLLELQSRYAHDQRFALDSRFYESDEENTKEETPQPINEKEKQFEILEQVIGYQVRKPDNRKKNNLNQEKKDKMLLRFDPTRVDHSQFVVQPTQPEEKINIKEKFKKRKDRNDEFNNRIEENAVQVSKETFYKINDKIKDSLQTKDDTSFSLRKLFNFKETEEPNECDSNKTVKDSISLPPKRLRQSNPFKYDSSDAESDECKSKPTPTTKPTYQSALMQPFFFQANDPRFEELKEFFKNHEAMNVDEFSKKRKDLKRLIHHRQMNTKQKNRLFKNKLGGAKKRIRHKGSFVSKGHIQRSKFKSRTYK